MAAAADESVHESLEYDDHEPIPEPDNANGSFPEPGRGKGASLKTKKTRRGGGERQVRQ